MIPVKKEQEIYNSKSTKTQQFGVEFNNKAFEILSDSLYTDKERAVVREYMTNAYDSHVDAGTPDKPFRVHVPTKLEPFFEVQDYGIGLDEDGVMKTFATFFHSTKETNNDVNGCLGLGSKSAFAVSDTFTIVSVKDSKSSTYSCYKDRDGVPNVDLKFSKDTDECNGVTIRIPVDHKRISTWVNKIYKCMACYDIEPKHNLFKENDDMVRDNFYLYRQRIKNVRQSQHGYYEDTSDSGVFVLMGNVVYPVTNPETFIKNKGLKGIYKVVEDSCRVILKCELGEVGIAPSREALSMDYRTRQVVSHKLTKVLIEKYRNTLKDVGSVQWDNYYRFYHTFKHTKLWDTLQNFHFPFTNGDKLYNVEKDHYYKRDDTHLHILHDYGFRDEDIKGYVDKVYGGKVLSSYVTGVSHKIVRKWTNIVIAYGETKKLRPTLVEISKLYSDANVLWAEDEDVANKLQDYFGVEDHKIVQASLYTPQTERKKIDRKKYGKLADTTVIAKSVDIVKGVIDFARDIDLTQGNIVYIQDEYVKFHNCSYKACNTKMTDIFQWLNLDTVVIANLNNIGKIKRAGIKSFEEVFHEAVKPYRTKLVKVAARKDFSLYEDTASRLLSEKIPEYKKLNKYYKVSEDLPPVTASDMGWRKTKLYEQESKRLDNLYKVWQAKVEDKKKKLPLLHRLNKEEDIRYYMKLEKVLR